MKPRLSKISQLPKSIRDQLNRRLENGKQGPELLPWLNALPETKELLAEKYEGRLITHQNLSEWRRGGYRDWLQQQHRMEWFDHFTENETELKQHDKCGDTYEAMSRIFLFEIGQGLTALPNLKNPQARMLGLQNLAREFSRLQNAYNFSRKTQLDFDKWNQRPYDEPPIEEQNDDKPKVLGAPISNRLTASTSPEREPLIEARTLPSSPQSEESNIPQPAGVNRTNDSVKPTISVSLAPLGGEGRGEGALRIQEEHNEPTPIAAPPLPIVGSGLKTENFKPIPAFQTIPALAPTPHYPMANHPLPQPPVRKPSSYHATYYPRIRRSRFAGLEG